MGQLYWPLPGRSHLARQDPCGPRTHWLGRWLGDHHLVLAGPLCVPLPWRFTYSVLPRTLGNTVTFMVLISQELRTTRVWHLGPWLPCALRPGSEWAPGAGGHDLVTPQ